MQDFEDSVEETIHEYVLQRASLGIYDPLQTRRPRVPVVSFSIELLEIGDDAVAHAAGPVILRAATGEVEKFLRLSVPVTADGRIADEANVRAAYIEETGHEHGACKETAALANA